MTGEEKSLKFQRIELDFFLEKNGIILVVSKPTAKLTTKEEMTKAIYSKMEGLMPFLLKKRILFLPSSIYFKPLEKEELFLTECLIMCWLVRSGIALLAPFSLPVELAEKSISAHVGISPNFVKKGYNGIRRDGYIASICSDSYHNKNLHKPSEIFEIYHRIATETPLYEDKASVFCFDSKERDGHYYEYCAYWQALYAVFLVCQRAENVFLEINQHCKPHMTEEYISPPPDYFIDPLNWIFNRPNLRDDNTPSWSVEHWIKASNTFKENDVIPPWYSLREKELFNDNITARINGALEEDRKRRNWEYRCWLANRSYDPQEAHDDIMRKYREMTPPAQPSKEYLRRGSGIRRKVDGLDEMHGNMNRATEALKELFGHD